MCVGPAEMANYIRVDDGDTYRLDPEIDPAELTTQIATALEGGDSVTVGLDFPDRHAKTGALTVGRNASCVLLTTDESE
jgi:hypothetical protein